MGSTITIKLAVFFALILILAYVFRIEEHLPAMLKPEYLTTIYFIIIGLVFSIFLTVIFILIDLSDIDNAFKSKRI